MADAPDLGSGSARIRGSSPLPGKTVCIRCHRFAMASQIWCRAFGGSKFRTSDMPKRLKYSAEIQRRPRILGSGEIVTGRQRWPVSAANEPVVVHVPDRSLAAAWIVEDVIGFPIAIEIGRPNQLPTAWQSGPVNAAYIPVVVQMPDRALPRTGVEEQIIRFPVVIEINPTTHPPASRSRRPVGCDGIDIVIQVPN